MAWMRSVVLILVSCLSCKISAQSLPPTIEDEIALYASTKQVNQFFRRFNNEESIGGKRYYEKDSLYRDPKTRAVFLKLLFDNENLSLSDKTKGDFIKDIMNPVHPLYLDFHGGKWVAQVSCIFYWNGKEEKATIFLKLQEEKVGSKWVISRIRFLPFEEYLKRDSADTVHFLHPLSHELEFMNLYKVFHDDKDEVQNYTEKDYEPDYLTLFLFEIKKGNLRFKTVNNVKFHFFQIDNWYFELSQFNRSGYNNGWLISNLVSVKENEKESLMKFIYEKYE